MLFLSCAEFDGAEDSSEENEGAAGVEGVEAFGPFPGEDPSAAGSNLVKSSADSENPKTDNLDQETNQQDRFGGVVQVWIIRRVNGSSSTLDDEA